MLRNTILTLLAASAVLAANAVPAKRGIHNITQPDGTTLPVLLVGDEHRHIYLTPDSLPITPGADGFMEYGRLDGDRLMPTGVRAKADAALRTAAERALLAGIDAREVRRTALSRPAAKARHRAIAQKGIGRFDDSFPVVGDVKALVILVNYKDVKFSTPNAAQYFSDMLMKEGFNDYNGTGSARDYFVENSMGAFRPQFDCYGPVELPQNRSYYGGNDAYGDDKAAEDMIIHAVQLLNDDVDFSQYDTDGDGYVDNVFVFYAGTGEASGGPDSSVWPHAYYIASGAGKWCMADGVIFDRYACSNEWEGSRPDGIGTFVHEFSHVMGLPDLYDTENESNSVTPGSWSVLDYGPYNNNGCTPPAYSAYERNALGWNEPIVLDGPANITLEEIIGSNTSCLIPTEKSSEFFLLENRQKTGWDAYLPGHGMLVWHIDYAARTWQQNAVNNNQQHQYVDIVEAGGRANSKSRSIMAQYPFPGTRNKTSFTSTTTPALVSWAGKAIDLPITDITETNGKISFKVAGGMSGIADIAASDATPLRVEGRTLLCEGEDISVFDTAGRFVAGGKDAVELPAPGLYLVRAAGTTTKLAVKR
ncbi:MAG: M6 family metalloprotease domain-containing protein [Muribaculaceae bacterium]|nr:M6 family metalloprotease domain-containing protein [Muribaculaceae bacterium]